LELAFARDTAINFLSPQAAVAVRDRLAYSEAHQTLNEDRLWADLLSSMPMCFNLFGPLQADRTAATRWSRRWHSDEEWIVSHIKFEWSPGRRDSKYLGNRSAFDAAVLLEHVVGDKGVIGIETKYHDAPESPRPPRLETAARYLEVAERSGVFVPGAAENLMKSNLQQVWQDHLLLLSMLQKDRGGWKWGRFLLLYPARNTAFAAAARRYRDFLVDDRTFASMTLEELLESGAFGERTQKELSERYLW
jgi:hypothetical protein